MDNLGQMKLMLDDLPQIIENDFNQLPSRAASAHSNRWFLARFKSLLTREVLLADEAVGVRVFGC